MLKNNLKPIYLNIKAIKFPITAIASILHRISGFILFIMIGPILWILKLSLSSIENFTKINTFLTVDNYCFLFIRWIIIIIFSYHIVFGVRQILMDCGFIKQTLSMGKISARVVFILVICLSVYVGIYIWNP
ncbi:succinate dehydrogenase cytochrome b-556 subunit [Candidatus Blochmanniella floridana]|uniref:Succinate dehydrogenase cytochrome b556 subunit n=1 Tax=Blochmanniella floridana TaxID=203907 RepID=Q7VR95_BLOFL|nr:succinate dehydrogenase cytochrome b-556 subunit [Candidatus Blochmannia floridanus]